MNFETILSGYDFKIEGTANHWYRFKSTNHISILLDREKNECSLVSQKFNVIRDFSYPEKLDGFLQAMFY